MGVEEEDTAGANTIGERSGRAVGGDGCGVMGGLFLGICGGMIVTGGSLYADGLTGGEKGAATDARARPGGLGGLEGKAAAVDVEPAGGAEGEVGGTNATAGLVGETHAPSAGMMVTSGRDASRLCVGETAGGEALAWDPVWGPSSS